MPNEFDNMVEQAINEMPPPSPIADKLNEEKPVEETTETTVTTSAPVEPPKIDETFDPSIHATDDAGNPLLNKDGRLKKKRGRKPGSVNATVFRTVEHTPEYKAADTAARSATETIFILGQMIGGEEWQPIIDSETGYNEPATIQASFRQYFLAKGITDFPPGVALSIALACYALPRLRKPQTQNRLMKFVGWIKSKFGV